MEDKNVLNVKVSPKASMSILESLRDKDPLTKQMLGEDWMDGYKTGIIDTLIMLGVSESELELIAKELRPLKQTITSL